MELLSVIKARSIWLFDLMDLNPRGKRIYPELLGWMKDSYNFSKVPSSAVDLDETKALAFLDGRFQISPENFIGVDLKLYNDGVVVDTWSSTKDSDKFIDEVLRSTAKQFDLVYSPEMIRKRLYLSELNVRCKSTLLSLNPKLKAFADKISRLVNGEVELCSIGFWAEQNTRAPFSPFRFERNLNAAFSEHRYYAASPLQTEDHLKLLDELENILAV